MTADTTDFTDENVVCAMTGTLLAITLRRRYNNCIRPCYPGNAIMIRAAITFAIALAAIHAPAEEKPLRVYFVGNSVTDTINYRALAELAKRRGHTQVWGRHMIPGAPLQTAWKVVSTHQLAGVSF